MFVQYLFELSIKFVQYYVCVNVCFVCVLTTIKKILICNFVNILMSYKITKHTSNKIVFSRSFRVFYE